MQYILVDTLGFLDQGRFYVHQWKRYIRGIPKEQEPWILTQQTIDQILKTEDFIHNLKIMDTLYTDVVKKSPVLEDFTDDDYYCMKFFNVRYK